jgi:5-methylcytosine-specific restriction protein A
MIDQKPITGGGLNATYKLGAAQARYREDGMWYHPLTEFPGVLFDAQGYVLFETREEYESCHHIRKGPDPNHIHVDQGIASIPGYVKLAPPPLSL